MHAHLGSQHLGGLRLLNLGGHVQNCLASHNLDQLVCWHIILSSKWKLAVEKTRKLHSVKASLV